MEILILIVVAGLIIAGAIYSSIQAQKRRQELAALAASLELRFDPDHDPSVDDRYRFLDKLCQGSNRYAFNTLYGPYQGHEVRVFDYHYETHSHDSKGRRQTHHHYFSFFILHLPGNFPELTVTQEGLFSKVAQFSGYDDIDFESAEFSKRFCVRCRDKKFAYDIFNAQMIEYFLANRDLSVEIERDCLALFYSRRLASAEIARNLDRLLEIRARIPEYLWRS
jgi:hypothetical protein